MLWGGAFIALVAYLLGGDVVNLYLSIVLVGVVLISGTFSYHQESTSAKVMAGFRNYLPQQVKVRRDSTQTVIPATELVCGDIVFMAAGEKIPADLRILSSSADLSVDNSALTGESKAQKRAAKSSDSRDPEDLSVRPDMLTLAAALESRCVLYFGALILRGNATALVVGTGTRTVMGRIAQFADETATEITPLAVELNTFIRHITFLAVVTGVIFLIVGFLVGNSFIDNIIFLIGIIIAFVPEGLLATVTVCLTLTAQRLARQNVLVKNLEAVETLGSTSVICSDKTGTLTTGTMTVRDAMYDTHDAGFQCSKEENLARRTIRFCALACNDSAFNEKGNITGGATDRALLKYGSQLVRDGPNWQDRVTEFRNEHCERTFEIPFNSVNKWQLVALRVTAFTEYLESTVDIEAKEASNENSASVSSLSKSDGKGDLQLLVLKGAPEKVIRLCQSALRHDGSVSPLDENDRFELMESFSTQLSQHGRRVLGTAVALIHAKVPLKGTAVDDVNFDAFAERRFCFVGVYGLAGFHVSHTLLHALPSPPAQIRREEVSERQFNCVDRLV
ncbi:MAG: hypothetical protein MHM6MM_006268 [Cercozoa sp. M6MM]